MSQRFNLLKFIEDQIRDNLVAISHDYNRLMNWESLKGMRKLAEEMNYDLAIYVKLVPNATRQKTRQERQIVRKFREQDTLIQNLQRIYDLNLQELRTLQKPQEPSPSQESNQENPSS